MRTVLAFALTLLTIAAVALPSTADTVVERGESDRIFLRWTPPAEGTDCGDDRYLSTRAGSDDVVCTAIYATAVDYSFPSRDLAPFTLDAEGVVDGEVVLSPALGLVHGIAVVDVTVDVSATVEGSLFPIALGSHTEQIIISPASTGHPIAFSFDVDDAEDLKTVNSLTLDLAIDGPQVLPYDMSLDGASYFNVPQAIITETP